MNKQKSDIRQRCRDARLQIGGGARRDADAQISSRLGQLVTDLHSKTISIFWPIARNGEIDTRPFIRDLVQSDIVVALPCVSPTEPGVMHMRQFIGENDLEANKWGAGEPQSGRIIGPADIDLMVVPALAAGRDGNRIGYGSGYYDRFLKLVHCPTATIVYSTCMFDEIPGDRHDVRVTFVITELDTIVIADPAT